MNFQLSCQIVLKRIGLQFIQIHMDCQLRATSFKRTEYNLTALIKLIKRGRQTTQTNKHLIAQWHVLCNGDCGGDRPVYLATAVGENIAEELPWKMWSKPCKDWEAENISTHVLKEFGFLKKKLKKTWYGKGAAAGGGVTEVAKRQMMQSLINHSQGRAPQRFKQEVRASALSFKSSVKVPWRSD